jgi:hypothetical protein
MDKRCCKLRNSSLFYILTKLKDRLAPFLFPREMFKFRGKKLKVRFGKLIEPEIYDNLESDEELTILLRKYVYNLDDAPQQLKKHFRE